MIIEFNFVTLITLMFIILTSFFMGYFIGIKEKDENT